MLGLVGLCFIGYLLYKGFFGQGGKSTPHNPWRQSELSNDPDVLERQLRDMYRNEPEPSSLDDYM